MDFFFKKEQNIFLLQEGWQHFRSESIHYPFLLFFYVLTFYVAKSLSLSRFLAFLLETILGTFLKCIQNVLYKMYFFYFRTFSYLCIYNSCLFHVFLVFNIMMSCILNAMKAVLILLLSRTHLCITFTWCLSTSHVI